jgi:hypothetical protein
MKQLFNHHLLDLGRLLKNLKCYWSKRNEQIKVHANQSGSKVTRTPIPQVYILTLEWKK